MLTEKDYCDYETCVALMELGYNKPSIAFYPCQDIIVDCIDSNGELYEAEYYKGNLALYSSLNNKNHDINKVQAPLLYEAQKWLREEKGTHVLPELGLIHRNKNGITHYYRVLVKNMNNGIIITLDNDRDDFESYEEALSEGIKEVVKLMLEGRLWLD